MRDAVAFFIAEDRCFFESAITMKISNIISIQKLGFQWGTKNPFLFCVHHEDFFPKGNSDLGPDRSHFKGRNIGQDFEPKDGWRMYHGERVPGFPHHPHRGFETVTVVQKGYVDHSDSLGASGRYGMGDTQWMTAGKGVQHSEMFPLLNRGNDNTMELFQIWLNLPAAKKFSEPFFKMLWSEKIPKYSHMDSKGKKTHVELIAGGLGSYEPISPPPDSWAADPENYVAVWILEMEPESIFEIPAIEAGISRTVYFFHGNSIFINDTEIPFYHSADLVSDTDAEIRNGKEKSRILLLQGRPINEPIVHYGPFVMNTKKEIQEAYDDYLRTEFGGWPWNSPEPVHGNTERFAKYSDGRKELP